MDGYLKRLLSVVALALFVSLLVFGTPCALYFCNAVDREVVGHSEKRVDNVVRVFMHQPHEYTFMIEKDGTAELETHHFRYAKIRLVADVPAEDQMWALVREVEERGGYKFVEEIVIHIHSPKDINGAGWDRGKSGSGQTHVVE